MKAVNPMFANITP